METNALIQPMQSDGQPSPKRVPPSVFRPIQYLGNKLRSVAAITEVAQNLVKPNARILDLFTGSSVVSQSFAHLGFQVTAVDSQMYSQVLASALLGINRANHDTLSWNVILELLERITAKCQISEWDPYIAEENAALASDDYERLIVLYADLPLIWRATNSKSQDGGHLQVIGKPLITMLQAGIYFGVKQSLALDAIRLAIELAYARRSISLWARHAALTALMSAMSSAVHSAGKHFAQPLSAGASTNYPFLRTRMLQDRRIDITEAFVERCAIINRMAEPSDRGHSSFQGLAEDFLGSSSSTFELVYADPPYTAQQYSRFYHLLETLVLYKMPDLYHKGRVTIGLYPTNRFKSAFCSKRFAPDAFGKLICAARQKSAHLLISYSRSTIASNGNSRMISMEDLLSLCRKEFGRQHVECVPLSHTYRQFNSQERSNSERSDPEILIVCAQR